MNPNGITALLMSVGLSVTPAWHIPPQHITALLMSVVLAPGQLSLAWPSARSTGAAFLIGHQVPWPIRVSVKVKVRVSLSNWESGAMTLGIPWPVVPYVPWYAMARGIRLPFKAPPVSCVKHAMIPCQGPCAM